MVASLLLQVIVLLSGLILPRFILEAYGSSVNGNDHFSKSVFQHIWVWQKQE